MLQDSAPRPANAPRNYAIRHLTPDDQPFLWEMLYQSLYVPEGHAPIDRIVLNILPLRSTSKIGDARMIADS
ncbi:MAG: hypothetical protein IAF08_09345 [Rhizobacter sp.]|nr:hypothetical protein [Chlorobiales bacterium]